MSFAKFLMLTHVQESRRRRANKRHRCKKQHPIQVSLLLAPFRYLGNVYHVVDSETNDVLNVNVHHKEALANTSRSIIEKYLTLKPSTVEVGSKDSASTVQSISTTPNCPYCGKGLTHDRSHCPLLRTKLVQTIEQRLEDVRANDNEDPEVRSNIISALEAALERRRPATAKKEQSMTVSNQFLIRLVRHL